MYKHCLVLTHKKIPGQMKVVVEESAYNFADVFIHGERDYAGWGTVVRPGETEYEAAKRVLHRMISETVSEITELTLTKLKYACLLKELGDWSHWTGENPIDFTFDQP